MLLGGEEAAVKTGAYYLKGLSDSSNVLVQAGVKGLVGESKAIHDQTRDKYFFGKEYDEDALAIAERTDTFKPLFSQVTGQVFDNESVISSSFKYVLDTALAETTSKIISNYEEANDHVESSVDNVKINPSDKHTQTGAQVSQDVNDKSGAENTPTSVDIIKEKTKQIDRRIEEIKANPSNATPISAGDSSKPKEVSTPKIDPGFNDFW